jgi:1-pyrroline-5-carboxylate dehydrogenase
MLSGVHFTGGTETFKEIRWRIAQNEYQNKYRNFVRIVGETGGKDFIVVYDDHDPVETAAAIVVGGFGAQGRKCSATSRVYMTDDMWRKVKPHLERFMRMIKVGDVADFKNYMGAVINKREFDKIVFYIRSAVESARLEESNLEAGIACETMVKEVISAKSDYHTAVSGYFIWPTVIVTTNPDYPTMKEEIFGPVVTVCLLPKTGLDGLSVLELCDRTSPFALTGAVHTNDIYQFSEALEELRYSAGNIYNWKTTGAMVNAQPFSGARMSGTNSKVGWRLNLYNWVEARTVSLTHIKPEDFAPPYLDRD